jgi:hypothetical protein
MSLLMVVFHHYYIQYIVDHLFNTTIRIPIRIFNGIPKCHFLSPQNFEGLGDREPSRRCRDAEPAGRVTARRVPHAGRGKRVAGDAAGTMKLGGNL